MKLKLSISVVLTALALFGMLAITIAVSTIFAMRMWTLSEEQIKTITKEETIIIKDKVIDQFRAREQALFQTAAAMAILYEQSGAPAFNASAVPVEDMRAFLTRNRSVMSDVTQMFVANNVPTYLPGGYAVFSPYWEIIPNFDQRTRPWYVEAKKVPGSVSYTDPYMAIATRTLSTSLSTVVFDSNRNDIGVLVLDIAVSTLTAMANTGRIPEMKSWLLNRDGLFISNEDPEKVMKVNFFEDPEFEQHRGSILGSESFFGMDDKYLISSSLIPGANWIVVSAIPQAVVFKEVSEAIRNTIIIAVVLMTLIVVMLVVVIRRITKPIVTIAYALKDISEGEGDLTRKINIQANNEVGDLALYFNNTLEKIRNMVIAIKKQSHSLSGIGNDLASNTNKTAVAVNEITANIQNIKGRIINQSASVSETHATMEQLTGNINKLGDHVENQSVNVSRASAAIEQMVANIRSVTETLIKNSVNVKTLTDAAEVGRNGLQEVSANIQEIARESAGLLEINSVMENIASQTNLLSMNAAIEAAHAGESGKGFAVVSGEIRKLAESSSTQSKTIGTVLKKIKTSIDKITQSTENVLNKFEAIDSSVRTVADQEDNIRHAMEEQGEGSKQILEGISHVTDITLKVKSSSAEMLDGAKEVIRESSNLEVATQEITSGINEMAMGAEQINAAVNNVNTISGQNREGIDVLIGEVSRFKVT